MKFGFWLSAICLLLAWTQAPAAPCDTPEHRAFDFWLGDWQVHTPDGNLAGRNLIEQRYDGCVIHEQYTSVRNYKGESLNIYDAARKVWHQTWVDNTGMLLVLDGGVENGSMVLEGETRGDDGRLVRHRITWTPNPDSSVRQLWETTDAGGQWTVTFDGLYTRK